MSRKTINCIIACLLFLMPTLLCAQSLTTYEYWFDNGFNSRKTGSLSGSDAVVNIGIETGHLTNGVHRFSFRAKQSNGKYSAISSSLFLKRTVPQNSTLEYWVDGNIDQRESMSISNTEEEQSLELDLRNNTLYPFGFHKLYIRVAVEGEGESAIYSSPILKLSAGQASQLEYWIDDDLEHSKTLTGKAASDGDGYIYIDNLDLQDVPMGLHRLNCRAVSNSRRTVSAVTSSEFFKLSAGEATDLEYWIDDDIAHSKILNGNAASDGDGYIFVSELDLRDLSPGLHRLNCRAVSSSRRTCSAVVSSPILKLSAGKATQLEYWLDDDRENVHTIAGEAAYESSDYLFVSDLDLEAVTPGHHRLYCRAVSNSGKTTSAITMTPIIVKSKYHVDDPSTLTVTRQAYWIDDEEPVEKAVPNPENDMNFIHPINKRELSEGQHTIHMQYANSAGLWSSVGELTFTKEKTPDPVIQLTATEDKGLVTLNYNTVPYGFKYVVTRKYPSGKLHKVGGADDEGFPLALKATDTPPSGTYTYYVRGKYHGEDGEEKYINSNEVTVAVTEADNSVKRVNVNIKVVFDKGKTNIWKDDNLRVHFSDGSSKIPNVNGLITLNNIPVGTEMTMSIPFRAGCNYVADKKTFYVTENSPKQTIELLARENDERVTVTDACDLITEGEISTNPDSWYAKIGNGTGKSWKGKVFMRMVRKSDFEELTSYLNHDVSPDEGSGIITPADIPNTKIFINNMLTWKVAYQTDFSISKNGMSDHEMFMDFITLPYPDRNKTEDYYVFFSSLKEGDTQEKPMEGQNPKVLRINPHDITQGEVDEMERFCYYYAKVLKYFDNIKDWDDPVKLTWNSLGDAKDDIIDLAGKSEVTAEEANKIMSKYMVDEVGLTMIGLFGKSLKSSIKTAKQLKEMPDEVYKLITELQQYNAIKNAPPYHQFFKVANLIVKKSKSPFANVYSAYLTVGEAMASKIEELENKVSDNRMWQYFADGHVTCKVRVAYRDKNNDVSKYFNPYEVKKQIKSAKIEGFWRQYDTQPLSEDRKVTATDLKPSYDNDGSWLTINGGSYSQFKERGLEPIGSEIWLVIEWQDGNVIRVPLLDQRVVERKESGFEGAGSVTFSVDLCSGFYQDKYMTKAIHFDDK